jgi:hypothetical protein
MSLSELMKLKSEYTDSEWTGLPTGNSIGRRLGHISNYSIIADLEMQQGNTILCSHLALIDHRYRYIHQLKNLWFDCFEAEDPKASVEEKLDISEEIEQDAEGEGLPTEDDPSTRMRLGLPTSMFALFGEDGFRYQDPLPLVSLFHLQYRIPPHSVLEVYRTM